MNRAETLRTALAATTKERNKTYGHPYANMSATADLMTAYIRSKFGISDSFHLIAEDAAHFLTLVKIARTMAAKHHADNYIDAAAYQAIAGECRSTDEQDTPT